MWLWYKWLLPLFMDFLQSQHDWLNTFGHGLIGLCISAAQHYISLTPSKASQAN